MAGGGGCCDITSQLSSQRLSEQKPGGFWVSFILGPPREDVHPEPCCCVWGQRNLSGGTASSRTLQEKGWGLSRSRLSIPGGTGLSQGPRGMGLGLGGHSPSKSTVPSPLRSTSWSISSSSGPTSGSPSRAGAASRSSATVIRPSLSLSNCDSGRTQPSYSLLASATTLLDTPTSSIQTLLLLPD